MGPRASQKTLRRRRFLTEKGQKRRKTKCAGNWTSYFRARFTLINLSRGPSQVHLQPDPIMKVNFFRGRDKKKSRFRKKLENFVPAKTKNRHFSPFSTVFFPAKTSTKQRKKPLFDNTVSPSCHKRKIIIFGERKSRF